MYTASENTDKPTYFTGGKTFSSCTIQCKNSKSYIMYDEKQQTALISP